MKDIATYKALFDYCLIVYNEEIAKSIRMDAKSNRSITITPIIVALIVYSTQTVEKLRPFMSFETYIFLFSLLVVDLFLIMILIVNTFRAIKLRRLVKLDLTIKHLSFFMENDLATVYFGLSKSLLTAYTSVLDLNNKRAIQIRNIDTLTFSALLLSGFCASILFVFSVR